MKISTRFRYGLRALVAVARCPEISMTSESIAAKEDVSKKYLDEILGTLRQHGILKGFRGRLGGYGLAREPEEINVLEVMEVLEGSTSLVPCVDDDSVCARSENCPTRPVWTSATESYRDVFRSLTLASFLVCEEEDCSGPHLPSLDVACPDAEE